MKDQYGLEYLEESEDIERPMRTTANMRSLGKLLTWKTLDGLCAQQIDPVVDAYFHAVTSVWPQSRYYPGWDSKLFFRPLSLLITPVQDWILLTLEKLIVRMSR